MLPISYKVRVFLSICFFKFNSICFYLFQNSLERLEEITKDLRGPPGLPGIGNPGKQGLQGVQGIPGTNILKENVIKSFSVLMISLYLNVND